MATIETENIALMIIAGLAASAWGAAQSGSRRRSDKTVLHGATVLSGFPAALGFTSKTVNHIFIVSDLHLYEKCALSVSCRHL